MAALHGIARFFSKPDVLIGLGVFSIVAIVATMVLVPVVIARMPADYLVKAGERGHGNVVLVVLKNIAGVVLVLLGIAMLILPGQGILTLLLGLGLVDFPGRRRLELKVMTRPSVLKAINALRRRAGRAPLEIPRSE